MEVNPDSEDVIRHLAAVEGELGDFESAHQRLTQLISTKRALVDPGDRDKLIDWETVRGRVVIRWAAYLRDSGRPANSPIALELLQGSARDLVACEAAALEIAQRSYEKVKYQEIAYYYFWIATETWLTLGEFEREGGKRAQSRNNFLLAKKAFDRLEGFAKANGIVLPARAEDLRKGIRDGLLAAPASRGKTQEGAQRTPALLGSQAGTRASARG